MSITVNLPSFTIGPDAYDELGKYASFMGSTAAIIGGEIALEKSIDKIEAATIKAGISVTTVEWYGGEASYSNIDWLSGLPGVKTADMIFAVGGGRALDTAKTVADKLGKPVFTFPTIASTCAPTSAVCILYHDNHESAGTYRIPSPPVHAFADTEIIAEAPVKYIWAGIGDALSKEIEASFSAKGRELSYKNTMGVHIVDGVNDRIMVHGQAALDAARKKDQSPAIDQILFEILGSTSYTSVLVDHAYNSHFAHSFYYGVTVLPQGANHLHGEIVSYGVLVVLQLAGEIEKLKKLRAFMLAIGLPTSLKDLDIYTEEDLTRILDKSMTTDHIKTSPFTIDRRMIETAIKAVEALNQ